ncbi:DoxX family protein [Novosphingobium aquiterrae]|uniref:DoxX family protein n=1 Tax=Novosphingobium aquiterrae TaxID=624388 RepID=A0ABV6PHA7_9SPHN
MIRTILRWVLALFYLLAGVIHLANPAPFLTIMPPWVPAPELVVALTGIAELAGAAGLLQPWSGPLRRAAGWGLALYALCVWPANFQHMINDHGLHLAYHIPRLAFQPVLIWLALWVSGATDWPGLNRRPDG